MESGLLRGVVRELQGALNLTCSAVVARQEPLITGHGGSQLGLAKELAPFYWRTTLHSSNYVSIIPPLSSASLNSPLSRCLL